MVQQRFVRGGHGHTDRELKPKQHAAIKTQIHVPLGTHNFKDSQGGGGGVDLLIVKSMRQQDGVLPLARHLVVVVQLEAPVAERQKEMSDIQ